MIKILTTRFKQGYKTYPFPKVEPQFSDRYRGLPTIDHAKCISDCQICASQCPTQAIELKDNKVVIDLGKCLFCTVCQDACPKQAIGYTQDYQLASNTREGLVTSGSHYPKASEFSKELKRLYGRALRLRVVSAGGCNGCEADTNVLGTLVFDLGRFGISFVASPRHADGILITGPVTHNMKEALLLAYEAIPSPKIAIAVGACAISGGPFADSPHVHNGANHCIPIDLYIPGCPPHPWTILDGLLRLMGQRK